MRLLSLFAGEEWHLSGSQTGDGGSQAALPQYGREETEKDTGSALPEGEEAVSEFFAVEGGRDPFLFSLFEAEPDTDVSLSLPAAPARKTQALFPEGGSSRKRREIFDSAGTDVSQSGRFLTFPTVNPGKTTQFSTRPGDGLSLTEHRRAAEDEIPHIPTVDELLDELERRLSRELQTETEGIYR